MRLRTKACLTAAIVFLALFLMGESNFGQRFLVGTPPSDHWELDDRVMGAALAPFVYCLVPAMFFFAAFLVMLLLEKQGPERGDKDVRI
jgi:hypothetical protein